MPRYLGSNALIIFKLIKQVCGGRDIMANQTEQEHDDHGEHEHDKGAPRGIFVIFVALSAGRKLH